jgi:hypothetical protein
MIGKQVKRGVKIALGLAAMAVFGFIVMYLWNWLAPAVFAARTITFWQALGLLVLARILVGGLGGGHGDDKHGRRSMMDRWKQMTPEEREAFRQGLRNCGEGRGEANTPPAAPNAAPSA